MPTLWTVCQALMPDELSALYAAALHEDRVVLKQLIQGSSLSLTPRDTSRLQDELIRTVRGKSTRADSGDAHPSRAGIIRQLETLAGLGSELSQPSWKLEVVASSTPGSGDGVFLRGACAANTVLAVYPGVAYTLSDLPHAAKQVFEDNHYTLFLQNGVVVDGRPDGPSRAVFEAAKQAECAAGRPLLPSASDSMLGVGHKVNHPPRGVRPNVHVLPLDLGHEEHAALHPHLPVVNAHPPPAGSPWKRTAVLIASRACHDEELWLDYKLREEAHTLPAWYSAVPSEPRGPEPSSSDPPAEEVCRRPLVAHYHY